MEVTSFSPGLAVADSLWPKAQGFETLSVLSALGVSGVVVTPERIAPGYGDMSTANQVYAGYGKILKDLGLKPIALRDVVPTTDTGLIFGEKERQKPLLKRLRYALEVASRIGAQSISFGSPELRNGAFVSNLKDLETASGFFAEVSAFAKDLGVRVMIESSPQSMGCDFGTTLSEISVLIASIEDAEGLGIHLNTSSLLLEEDMLKMAVAAYGSTSQHIEICDPFFRIPSDKHKHQHMAVGSSLSRLRESGHGPSWVTASGRPAPLPDGGPATGTIIEAIQKVRSWYLEPAQASEVATSRFM